MNVSFSDAANEVSSSSTDDSNDKESKTKISDIDAKIYRKGSSEISRDSTPKLQRKLSDVKVVKNPLFGVDLSGLEKFPPFIRADTYNLDAQKYTSSELGNSGLLVPTRELYTYLTLRSISCFIKEIPAGKLDKSYYTSTSLYYRTYLLRNRILSQLILQRGMFILQKLNEYISSNQKSTDWIYNIVTLLQKFEHWSPVELRPSSDARTGVDQIEQLINFSWEDCRIDESAREFLITSIFGSHENYLGVKEFFSRIGKKPIRLQPIMDFLFGQVQRCLGTEEIDVVSRKVSCKLPPELLNNVKSNGIIRNYFPLDSVIFSKVSVNGNPLQLTYELGDSKQNCKAFFSTILNECHQKLMSPKDLDSFVEREVSHLLSGNDSDCSTLRLLGAGTLEAWNIADRMIRFMFPGLTSAPFQLKMPQGTELEIRRESMSTFCVLQRKRYQICLRSKPFDPMCFHCQKFPLCTITFEWSISSRQNSGDLVEEGELKIAEITYDERISLYERREIEYCLSNPQALPREWQTLPFPSIEREFPGI